MKLIFLKTLYLSLVMTFVLSGCMHTEEAPPSGGPSGEISDTPVDTPDVSPETGEYLDAENRFAITFPSDWTVQEDVMGTVVAAISELENENDLFAENVNVVIEPLPVSMTTEEYYDLNLQNMKLLIANFEVHNTDTLATDGRSLTELEYSGEFGEVSIHNFAYFVTDAENGYVITCSATPESFAQYKELFQEIAGSFRLAS